MLIITNLNLISVEYWTYLSKSLVPNTVNSSLVLSLSFIAKVDWPASCYPSQEFYFTNAKNGCTGMH